MVKDALYKLDIYWMQSIATTLKWSRSVGTKEHISKLFIIFLITARLESWEISKLQPYSQWAQWAHWQAIQQSTDIPPTKAWIWLPSTKHNQHPTYVSPWESWTKTSQTQPHSTDDHHICPQQAKFNLAHTVWDSGSQTKQNFWSGCIIKRSP
jgi:hypothetical protein